jgi:TonB family protein
MKPASVLLEPLSESTAETTPAPAFLVNLPPWRTVFLHNLSDLFHSPKDSSLHLYSRPGSFWPDVFVASHLPWSRFAQSLICHVAVIVALWGLVQLWPQKPQVLDPPVLTRADVIYYAPAEYLPPLDTGGTRRPLPQKGEPEHAPQPIISVPVEADNRTQTIVTPSDIKLNHDVALPNMVAWSQTPAQPAVPLASTTAAANLRLPEMPVTAVAPAAETMPANRQRAPIFTQTAVAPAPEVDAESERTVRAPQAAVVQPPPQVDAASAHRLGEITIGHAQVVAPAPELPMAEQYAVAGRTQAALAGGSNTGAAAVPPPPSIPGNAGSSPNGRIISLGIHPTAMSDGMAMPAGNRRGTFAATPEGKTGAPGTPDISASTNPGGGSGSGKSRDGIPSGLIVGAGPDNQNRSAVAGQGPGNGTGGGTAAAQSPGTTRLMADATPPRVSSTPPRSLSEVSRDKATDVDRWIFGDKKFYAVTLNMPNLNSAGGSWVIRFAELNPNEAKGDLTAPEATRKVDPAYPLELMRRNVQGTVTLYAVIRNDGSVSDVRVLRGVDDRLDQYARTALAHWRFRPATKNGAAVDLEAVVVIPFKAVRLKTGF